MSIPQTSSVPVSSAASGADPRQIRNLFDDFGYVVLRGVLSAVDLRPVLDEYEALLDSLARRWHEDGELTSAFADLPFSKRLMEVVLQTGARYYQHFNISLPGVNTRKDTPINTGPGVFGLLRNRHLLDAVEHFIGPEVFSNPVQNARFKVPERILSPEDMANPAYNQTIFAATYWHQDQHVVRKEAEHTKMLTVWVALTASTRENGCMKVVPASHKGGLVLHCGGKRPGIPEMILDGIRHYVEMEAGDVLFMHRCTQHGSLPNLSDDIRFSFDLRYQPSGQPTGRPWAPGFVARSRSRPETELRDPAAWTRLWHQARSRLAAENQRGVPFDKGQTNQEHPWCA